MPVCDNTLTEGWMTEESDYPKIQLKLKNGAAMSAQRAFVKWKLLASLQQKYPAHFHLLLLLASGKVEHFPLHVNAELYDKLGVTFFQRGGSIDPETRDILASSYRETAEGPM